MTSYMIWAIYEGTGSESEWDTHTGDLARVRRKAMDILKTEPIGYFGKEYGNTKGHPVPRTAKIAQIFADRMSGYVVLYRGKFYWFKWKDDRKK